MHNLLTVKEAAEYLRIPVPTVYYLVQRGRLPAMKIGGHWRIKKWELDQMLKGEKIHQTTVLVVVGDQQPQSLLKLFLKKIGFARVVVGTVKGALTVLGKQRFDLLLLDLELPDGPANEICEAARRINQAARIAVITDDPDSEMLKRIVTDGPVTVLTKPLELQQLQQLFGIPLDVGGTLKQEIAAGPTLSLVSDDKDLEASSGKLSDICAAQENWRGQSTIKTFSAWPIGEQPRRS